MNNDFNFPSSDNEENFWHINSPGEAFDSFKFDISSPMESFLEPKSPNDKNIFNANPSPEVHASSLDNQNLIDSNQKNSERDNIFGHEQMDDDIFGNDSFFDAHFSNSFQNSNNFNFESHFQMNPNNQRNGLPLPPQAHHRRNISSPSFQFNFNSLATPKPRQESHEIPVMTNRNTRMSSQPLPLTPEVTSSSDKEFQAVCNDPSILFNPHKLGFIPHSYWPDKDFTFGELVKDFFQRKNSKNSRFYHKLYNSLKIFESDPFYAEYLGIEWINNNVLKVDKQKFARLLGIKTIDGSLFHQQGNFPTHGFVELSTNNAKNFVSERDLVGVDYENVRLLVHQAGVFVRGCTENVIESCRWVNTRKRH